MTFEKWWQEEAIGIPETAYEIDLAKAAWQAATRAERERAAKVADDLARRVNKGEIFILSDVADAIRKGEGV